jgi:hypothetical protein
MIHANLCLKALLFMSPFLVMADPDPPLTPREQKMLDRIDALEQRLATLEARLGQGSSSVGDPPKPVPDSSALAQAVPKATGPYGFLSDTTFNMTLDGYYEYNFNRPAASICCVLMTCSATASA